MAILHFLSDVRPQAYLRLNLGLEFFYAHLQIRFTEAPELLTGDKRRDLLED